ncbi:MAG TPA: glycosyltransferase [Pyrinomonadaceae bacterium]|jgi:glycosyltransferase involved in cell wall biosynthesis
MRTLYLCYFGLREPLVQTQVLPYLRQLAAAGIEVYLLTFEPEMKLAWNETALAEERSRLEKDGIRWSCLAYHKRPSLPATLYDIRAGASFARRLVRRHGIDVLHARSHVPAVMGALAKRGTRARLIFDIRGFMPEEYVDAGLWPAGGYLYRLAKRTERWLLSRADAFVVLTEQARRILFDGATAIDERGRPVRVIPCCVDARRFEQADDASRDAWREELGLTARRVIVYVGALGGWYMTAEMAEFLAAAHRQDAATFSLVLTQSPAEMMAERLRALGVAETDFLVRRVAPREVPRYLKSADLALSFIKPCYSKLASSPTKIAEALASGLPIISNTGIGDLDAMIEGDRVGTIVREFNERAYLQALAEADALREDSETAARCRRSARERFDLEKVGGRRYVELYRALDGADNHQPPAQSPETPGG